MSSDTGRRVLLIGLDSADAELVEQWMDEGHLPHLSQLRQDGVWGSLKTTASVLHVSAWPTMYTGTLPGKHGLYHAYQIRAGEQNVHRTCSSELAQPPFWKFLDDAGKRCIVFDAFMDYPLAGFRGRQVVEYGTWTWFTDPGSQPTALWRELTRRFGPYPAPEHTRVLEVPDAREFRDKLVAGARVKGDATRWFVREHDWDFLFVTFGEPHPAGHYLWHASDPSHPSHSASTPEELHHAVRDVYVAVDRAIGSILDSVDDRTTVLVTSGDGMGPNYSGAHLIPEVLHRLDLYHAADVGEADQASGEKRTRKSLLSTLRGAIPLSLRHAVTRCLPRSLHYKLSMKWANADIDWERTRAFCIPNANEAYVRLNVQGREPQGIVDAGAVYEEEVLRLKEQLSDLINPTNGQRAAQELISVDDVFPGPQRPHLPDLVVTWDPSARVLNSLESPRCGRVTRRSAFETAPYYSGNHRACAFVLARGPEWSPGVLEKGHIADLAPTILTLLGVDAPDHFDGCAWSEVTPGARRQ